LRFNALLAGTAIEKLCEAALEDSLTDRGAVVRAARCLLGSVTRVLLLADVVVVKQLLLAKDKVRTGLRQLRKLLYRHCKPVFQKILKE
jgi:hypothetical protein